jgi:hypothetical protein
MKRKNAHMPTHLQGLEIVQDAREKEVGPWGREGKDMLSISVWSDVA